MIQYNLITESCHYMIETNFCSTAVVDKFTGNCKLPLSVRNLPDLGNSYDGHASISVRFACAIKYNPPSIRSTKLKLSNDPTVLEYHRSILTTIQTTCHLSYHEQKAKQSHSVTDMSKKTSNSIVCLCQRLLHGLRHRAQMPRTLFRIFKFTSLCHHAAILSSVINIWMSHTDTATCRIPKTAHEGLLYNGQKYLEKKKHAHVTWKIHFGTAHLHRKHFDLSESHKKLKSMLSIHVMAKNRWPWMMTECNTDGVESSEHFHAHTLTPLLHANTRPEHAYQPQTWKCRSSSRARFQNSSGREYKMQIESETFRINSPDCIRLRSICFPRMCPRRRVKVFVLREIPVWQRWLNSRNAFFDSETKPTWRRTTADTTPVDRLDLSAPIRNVAKQSTPSHMGACALGFDSRFPNTIFFITLFIHFRQVAPDMTVPCFVGYRNPQRSFAKRQCATSRLSSQHMWPRRGSGVRFTCNAASSTKLDFSFSVGNQKFFPRKSGWNWHTSHMSNFPLPSFIVEISFSLSLSVLCTTNTFGIIIIDVNGFRSDFFESSRMVALSELLLPWQMLLVPQTLQSISVHP